ncbi:MAG TPA: hypothetical protein VFD42_06375, partial [Chloroflexota bacterium]|nr:hypothetical protein [Chloroflexota bacterium]
NGVQGRILSFDGRSSSGEWAEEAWIPDSYVAGWAVFDNLLFCGSGRGGRIWAFDGEEMVEAHRLTWAGQGYEPPVRALGVWGGRLYAGCIHPTEGTALISKLPSAMLGVPGRTGDAMELSRRGWCTPCAAGPGGNARAMAAYGGCLYLAGEAVGAAAVYRKETSTFRGSGVMETSSFDGGHPTTPKLLRSLSLTHGRLGSGQSLGVSFALEGSDSFQHVEGFDSLAGRDAALATADWRPADSLVRLRGMPALGFAGKHRGDLRVPHTAHRLASDSPSSPPAEFVEELDDADYSALAAVGAGAALATNPAQGGYAHLLFQFDLAGLNPAGLRPRAVCHGRGDWFDVVTPGVMLRIWNHFTSSWNLLGSHQAPAGADPAARTLEAEIDGWEPYAGPSGKVYLSLLSSYAGSPAAPSEVGSDLVEMAPFWAAEGEAVSLPPRLPSAQPVSSATLTLLESGIPAGTGIGLFMSADGGDHWEEVEDGVEHAFANPGGSLRWKARLTSTDGLDTPTIGRLKVDYMAGEWIPLGRSDTEGSTGATFPFPQGMEAGRVAFRVELAAADPASGPTLEGLSLEYALRAETRRRWEMELLCEGTAALPLRLLDGTVEARTGRELSELLWQAREASPVEMEDMDGTRRQVWMEGLEETLSGGGPASGVRTLARCKFVE